VSSERFSPHRGRQEFYSTALKTCVSGDPAATATATFLEVKYLRTGELP
jgi:hypothetical protein